MDLAFLRGIPQQIISVLSPSASTASFPITSFKVLIASATWAVHEWFGSRACEWQRRVRGNLRDPSAGALVLTGTLTRDGQHAGASVDEG